MLIFGAEHLVSCILLAMVLAVSVQGDAPCPVLRQISGSKNLWRGKFAFRAPVSVGDEGWSIEINLSDRAKNFSLTNLHLNPEDYSGEQESEELEHENLASSSQIRRSGGKTFIVSNQITVTTLDTISMHFQFEYKKPYVEVLSVKFQNIIVCKGKCGLSRPELLLVKHGKDITPGDWPWIVAIYQKTDVGLDFHCGGCLVGRNIVVTAAHCIKYPRYELAASEFVVYVGRHHLLNWGENDDSQARTVKKIVVHPGWTSSTVKDHDLAVMVLTTPVLYTDTVQPVCLVQEQEDKLLVGSTGTVVGWGADENRNSVTTEPKSVTLPIVSQQACLQDDPFFVNLTSDFTFCAGYRNGSGPCTGDSGGGMYSTELFSDGRERWVLRGIVSKSLVKINGTFRDCDLDHFIVFNNMAKYTAWITGIENQFQDNDADDLLSREVQLNIDIRRKGLQCLARAASVSEEQRLHEISLRTGHAEDTSQLREDISGANLKIKNLHDKILEICKDRNERYIAKFQKLDVEKIGDKYYYLEYDLSKGLSWSGAQQFCQSHGLELVSVETEEVSRRVIAYIGKKTPKQGLVAWYFWLGASDIDNEGVWTWSTTGKNLSYTDWARGQPNNLESNENCLMMQVWKSGRHEWYDVPCEEKYGFLCELEDVCALEM